MTTQNNILYMNMERLWRIYSEFFTANVSTETELYLPIKFTIVISLFLSIAVFILVSGFKFGFLRSMVVLTLYLTSIFIMAYLMKTLFSYDVLQAEEQNHYQPIEVNSKMIPTWKVFGIPMLATVAYLSYALFRLKRIKKLASES